LPVSPRTKLVLIFAGKTLGFLIVLSLLWHFVFAAPYDRALVAITDSLSSAEIVLGEDLGGETREAFLAESGVYLKDDFICLTTLQPWGYDLYGWIEAPALAYGMLLVISLIAATPGLVWRRRLKFIGLALVIMFTLHLVTILIFARMSLSGVNPYPFSTLFISIGTALFPALIWGALCYRYWWPRGAPG
jgi:hypothetical protein